MELIIQQITESHIPNTILMLILDAESNVQFECYKCNYDAQILNK